MTTATRRRRWAAAALTTTAAAGTVLAVLAAGTSPPAALPITDAPLIYAPDPPDTPGLVTNEYAYWNPASPAGTYSPDWSMTSGTLLADTTDAGPAYWTGPIDTTTPDATSTTGTNSAVFRLTTRRTDFGDVAVRTKIRATTPGHTATTPAVPWDGIHLYLRYQNQHHLYYASVARRDGVVVVKKKCPGGPSNDGTYYTLATTTARWPIAPHTWKWYAATIRTTDHGHVTIDVYRVDLLIATATDTGAGCPAITTPGAVGIRADNTAAHFQHFRVRQL